MGFNQNTLDFLFENRIKDSRVWFKEHNDIYVSAVKKPLYDFVNEIAPSIIQIDSEIVTEPRRVLSRINRDIRFTKDKSIYRDCMWCTFVKDKHIYAYMPAFFFEFSPTHYRYGCGYYYTDTKLLEILRNMVLNRDPAYAAAEKMLSKQSQFEIQGEMYKRLRYEEQPDKMRQWLNRKDIYFSANCSNVKDIFSDDMVMQIADGFKALTPVYEFLCKVSLQYQMERPHK